MKAAQSKTSSQLNTESDKISIANESEQALQDSRSEKKRSLKYQYRNSLRPSLPSSLQYLYNTKNPKTIGCIVSQENKKQEERGNNDQGKYTIKFKQTLSSWSTLLFNFNLI